MSFTHKIGDSIKWELRSLQSDGITPVNWSGFVIEVSAINKVSNVELFRVSSSTPTADSYIKVDELNIGKFSVIIKNTDNFHIGDYSVDIRYTSPEGFKQSSKSIPIKIVNRL